MPCWLPVAGTVTVFQKTAVRCFDTMEAEKDNNRMAVGKNIRIRRKELNITSVSLAEQIGVSQGMVSQYENGDVRRIPKERLEQIAAVLQCSVNDLISGDPKYGPVSGKTTPAGKVTEEEYQMILNFRRLPLSARETVKEICRWRVYDPD